MFDRSLRFIYLEARNDITLDVAYSEFEAAFAIAFLFLTVSQDLKDLWDVRTASREPPDLIRVSSAKQRNPHAISSCSFCTRVMN